MDDPSVHFDPHLLISEDEKSSGLETICSCNLCIKFSHFYMAEIKLILKEFGAIIYG